MPFLRTKAVTGLFDVVDEDFSPLSIVSLKSEMREPKEQGSPLTEINQCPFSPDWTAMNMENPVTHPSKGS